MICLLIVPPLRHRPQELSNMLGEEISRVIQEQRALEKKYEQLIEERRNMKGLSNRAKFQANEDEIQRTANALRQSTKILTRNLQDNPNVEGNMHKIQSERSALETLLVNTAHELQFAYAPALAPYSRTLQGAVRRACCKRGLPRSARIGT
jgi:exonuclease VII large subunit